MKTTPFIKRVISYPLDDNCWLFGDRDSREIAVIDPGNSKEIVMEIEKFEGKVVAICITHSHFDHIEGNGILKEKFNAPIIIGKGDKDDLTVSYKAAELFGMKAVQSPAADRVVSEGDIVQIGSYNLTVLEFPGHTPGLIAFYEKECGVMFSGDLLFYESIGRFDLPRGDFAKMKESLKKLAGLPDEVKVYSGHGRTTTIGYERVHNPYKLHFQ